MNLDGPILIPDPYPTLPITRRHHPFDFENPLEQFESHQATALRRGRANYVGPRVVVTCDRPTPKFWRVVYAEKGAWFRAARKHFPRDWLENPRQWFDPTFPRAPLDHLQEHRKACVTGSVFLYSTEVRPRCWPSPETVGYRPRVTSRGHRTNPPASTRGN
ncbi:hypothetical protein MalM25_33150 [Planctomycetes bacterium MalM25]|nr:hypothetical protein MalM25_33150 [Planctomycetes bacterium MalM25]